MESNTWQLLDYKSNFKVIGYSNFLAIVKYAMCMIDNVGEFHTLYRMKSPSDKEYHYVTLDIFNDAIANANVVNDDRTVCDFAKLPSEIISELNKQFDSCEIDMEQTTISKYISEMEKVSKFYNSPKAGSCEAHKEILKDNLTYH